MEPIVLAFDDIDLMCESVRGWDLNFQPLAATGSERAGQVIQYTTPTVLLTRADLTPPLQQEGAAPVGCVTFVVQSGHMRGLWWRAQDVDAESVLVFPIGGELSCTSGSGFSVFTLSVGEALLRQMLADLELDLPKACDWAETFRAPETVLDRVRRSLHRVSEDDIDAADDAVRHSLRSLLTHWLAATATRSPSRPNLWARQRALRASLELLEAADLGSVRTDDLRAHAGVSERTLEYAFRERFGLTPAAFVKARRLARVRTALQKADPNHARIGDLMAEQAFYHVGQFAKDYRRLFSELPSATLAR